MYRRPPARRLTEDQAARVIQRAMRNRRSRRTNQYTLDAMRRAELDLQKQKHRLRLDAKEREYAFLDRLPPEAVLRLALRKQEEAARKL
jgi:hypothetical protein